MRPLLRELESAEQEVASLGIGEPSGHLRISLPGSFGAAWLGSGIASFLAAYPHVTLEADASNRFVDLIREGYDAAIRLGVLPDSGMVARKLAERRRVLCASPDYLKRYGTPATPADLIGHACLFSTDAADPGRWSFMCSNGETENITLPGRFMSPSAELLADAARRGSGILYTSDWYVGADLASGRLVEVLADTPLVQRGAVHIIVPASRGMPSKTRAFADWMAAFFHSTPWRKNQRQAGG